MKPFELPTTEQENAGDPDKTEDSISRMRNRDPAGEKSLERHSAYHLSEQERVYLGRERKNFEKWEELTFEDFLQEEAYQSPESVIAYFLDHPQVDAKESLVNLFLDNAYEEFVQRFFRAETKLNAKALSEEIMRVVEEITQVREQLSEDTFGMNQRLSQILHEQCGFLPPDREAESVIFIPSVEVYGQITGAESAGSAANPIRNTKNPFTTYHRSGLVPLAFKLQIDPTQLKLVSGNTLNSDRTRNVDWKDQAFYGGLHESEHARVAGTFNPEKDAYKLGYKYLPKNSSESKISEEMLIKGRERDEGITEFLALWKLHLHEESLQDDSSPDEIMNVIQDSISRSSYSHDLGNVIRDMSRFQESLDTNPLGIFLEGYYWSRDYLY